MGNNADSDDNANEFHAKLVQWTSSDDINFVPASTSAHVITPGFYEILHSNQVGWFFSRIAMSVENLIEFPETSSGAVVNEIELFWTKEKRFREYGLAYKRGILLFGPPGAGKTSTLKLAIKNIIEHKGIVVKFTDPKSFTSGMKLFRQIQPTTPVIVIMEDLDAIIETNNESEIINILDGVERFDKIIFIATTNYPERLGDRIINRPSRFDKKYKINLPDEQSRRLYLEKLIGKKDTGLTEKDIKKWVKDTKDLSISHIKELFTSVVIMEGNYEESLAILKKMKEKVTSQHDGGKMGFDGDD